jgi:hypothetical protein
MHVVAHVRAPTQIRIVETACSTLLLDTCAANVFAWESPPITGDAIVITEGAGVCLTTREREMLRTAVAELRRNSATNGEPVPLATIAAVMARTPAEQDSIEKAVTDGSSCFVDPRSASSGASVAIPVCGGPQHAALLLTHAAASEATVFTVNGESYCVAKRPPQLMFDEWRPSLRRRAYLGDLWLRASSPQHAWRRCAASLSTMMRYFQRAKDEFEWGSQRDKTAILIEHRGAVA